MTLPIQILLFVVILVLTVVLTAVGIQLFLALKEFRQAAEKVNEILLSARNISVSVSGSVSGFMKKFAEFSFAEIFYSLMQKLVGKDKKRKGVEKNGGK